VSVTAIAARRAQRAETNVLCVLCTRATYPGALGQESGSAHLKCCEYLDTVFIHGMKKWVRPREAARAAVRGERAASATLSIPLVPLSAVTVYGLESQPCLYVELDDVDCHGMDQIQNVVQFMCEHWSVDAKIARIGVASGCV